VKPLLNCVTDSRSTTIDFSDSANSLISDRRQRVGAELCSQLLGEHGQPNEAASAQQIDNLGVTHDLLPASFSLGVAIEPLSNHQLQHELFHLVTSPSLWPLRFASFPAQDVDDWLKSEAARGQKFAILFSAGVLVPTLHEFVIELIATVGTMNRERIPLMACVKGADGLHKRFLILNLQLWTECGQPKFASSGQSFGMEVVTNFVQSGYGVHETSADLHDKMSYADPQSTDQLAHKNIRTYIKNYIEVSSKNYAYVFNTEDLAAATYGLEPEVLISPCAGLKPFALFHNLMGRNRHQRVLFLERSPAAINYFSRLLKCRTYNDVLELQVEILKRQGGLPAEGFAYVESMMANVLAEGFLGNPEAFMQSLRGVAAVSTIHEMDYLDRPNEIIDRIGHQPTLFWHSNAWKCQPSLYRLSSSELRSNYVSLVENVAKFLESSAWIHTVGYEAVIGTQISSPRVVFTSGVRRKSPADIQNKFEKLTV
jgi:hypothetical protein